MIGNNYYENKDDDSEVDSEEMVIRKDCNYDQDNDSVADSDDDQNDMDYIDHYDKIAIKDNYAQH